MSCKLSKKQRPKIYKNSPSHITIPKMFQHVNIDVIMPLPTVDNCRYCFRMIDRFSGWPDAVLLKEICADTIATDFHSNWVARFKSPSTITMDRVALFALQSFSSLANVIGCSHVCRTAYHSASNDIIESWHRCLNIAIRSYENKNWLEVLPAVMLVLGAVSDKSYQ